MQEIDLLRLHKETIKYLEIENIFKRLTSTFLDRIYHLIKDIFAEEHKFTIQVHNRYNQELLKLANQKEISLKEFKLAEHYKLNSEIFKTNLQAIFNIVIDDLQNSFNKQVLIEERAILEPRLLTQIDEESQICLTENINEISQDYPKTTRDEVKTQETPIVNKEFKQSQSKNPLTKLLQLNKSSCLSIVSSPRHSRDNSINNSTFKQSNKQIQQLVLNNKIQIKERSIIKNKSFELNQIAESLFAQTKSPKANQTMILNNLMSKMVNLKENALK